MNLECPSARAANPDLDHPHTKVRDALRDSVARAMVQREIGQQVPRLFVEAGLMDVQTAPHVIAGDPHAFRLLFAHPITKLSGFGAISAERAG